MKTKFIGLLLAVAMLAAPLGILQSARAQGKDVYASVVTLDPVTEGGKSVEYKLPTLINMEKGGNFTYGGKTYYIYPNDGGVYDKDKNGSLVGRVTETKYYDEPAVGLTVDIVGFSHNAYGGAGTKWYYSTQLKLDGVDKPVNLTSAVVVKGKDGSFTVKETTYYYNKTGIVFSDSAHNNKVGELVKAYAVNPGDDFKVKVTDSLTGEPVNNATVKWGGATESKQTNAFGEVWLTVQNVSFFDDPSYGYGDYGAVKAAKEYGTNGTLKRSAYGQSSSNMVVLEFDLNNAGEFLAWWSNFALTKEAQSMYAAAEILGDWGANLGTEGVTVWSNIFGAKGGSLAKFIKGFPQFMVDRGAAIEATKNMLATIWALFTLLPAFVLATPQLLQTMPMRMLQFWPVLFINLDKVLSGVSDMVIDLGVFMTSLAPSVLLLLPEIFNRLPEIGPNAMSILLTSFELFVQMIPALSQYLPAAIAAIPAFYIQMLMALFFNAPAIISTAMGESYKTVTKLFRSWPLFPAGIAAGILAVAPAMMMLPSMAPLRLAGRTLENTVGALSTWMQQLRAAPSQLLDPILYACGTNPATLIGRYVAVFAYCLWCSLCMSPAIGIANFALSVALLPLSILAAILVSIPLWAMMLVLPLPMPVLLWVEGVVKFTFSCITGFFGMVTCTPTEWVSCTAFFGALFELVCAVVCTVSCIPCFIPCGGQLLWAGWMALSTIAAFAVNVPSTIAIMVSEVAKRCTQICTIPGYAVGWCLQGVLDILQVGCVKNLLDMTKEISARIPEIMGIIEPIVQQIVQVLLKVFPALINQFMEGGSISVEALAKICGGLVIDAVKPL